MDSRLPAATTDQARSSWRSCSISTMTLIAQGTTIETPLQQLGIPMSAPSDDRRPEASARDLAALQGDWEQVAFEENGVANPPDEYGPQGALTTFHGNHFAVRAADGTLLLEGSYTIDASTTPRAITWVDAMGADKGKPLLASYRLDGDDFVFIAADPGEPRPTVFRTVPGLTMRTLVRQHLSR